VVLIKVIQSIVHLGIIKVDIKSEFDITTLVCVSELLASLIIAQIKLAQLVSLIVEYVAKWAKEHKKQEHDREATAPCWSYTLMAHDIVKYALFICQIIYTLLEELQD